MTIISPIPSLQAIITAANEVDAANHTEEKIKDIFLKALEQEISFKIFEKENHMIKDRSEITWRKICIEVGSWILDRKYPKAPNLEYLTNQLSKNPVLKIEIQRLSGNPNLSDIFAKEHTNNGAPKDILYSPSDINNLVNRKAWDAAQKNVDKMERTGNIAIGVAGVTSLVGLGTLAYFYSQR